MAQSKTKFRIATKGLIKGLAISGGISMVVVAPNSLALIDMIMKKADKKKAARALTHLKYQKLVEVRQKGEQYEYRLSKSGWNAFRRIQLDELVIPTPKRWDRKWRLVMFDIPLSHQKQRQYFLRQLRSLDFYMLQRSAWIHPFECELQIGILLEYLGLERYASFLVIERGNFTAHASAHFKKVGLLI